MTTATAKPDRASINLRNAQKSTGPRTPEGKSRSRFNAVKHGMTAKTLVLPDEDADVLQMRVETWIADLQPQNDVEQFLVEQAVHASWKLDRAERAEVAQLSRIIGSVPIAEANRQHEVVAALGDWLLSDRNAAGDIAFRDDLLNVLVPPRPGPPDHRCLDIRNHPEAIVFRLESTAAGCQWLLDRWTELRGRLDQGAPWLWDEKVKAHPPAGETAAGPGPPEVAGLPRGPGRNRQPGARGSLRRPARSAVGPAARGQETREARRAPEPRGPGDGAAGDAGRGSSPQAEADAAQQAARLSFDASNEAERLRRYQFSCSRSLFRSLDTLIKVRRSGLVAASGDDPFTAETVEAAETKTPTCSIVDVPSSVIPPLEHGNPENEPTAPPVVDGNVPDVAGCVSPDPDQVPDGAGHGSPGPDRLPDQGSSPLPTRPIQNIPQVVTNPPVDDGNPQNEPRVPQLAASPRPTLPFHRTVVVVLILVVLSGSAVPSHRKPQNEPTAAPLREFAVDTGAVDELPETPRQPTWSRAVEISASPVSEAIRKTRVASPVYRLAHRRFVVPRRRSIQAGNATEPIRSRPRRPVRPAGVSLRRGGPSDSRILLTIPREYVRNPLTNRYNWELGECTGC